MSKVSIVLNARNGATTLREALDSVIAQTFTDWELIFWDDCSQDESLRIPQGYQDNRIRIYTSESVLTLGQARQMAIEQCTGEWLAFLDQDDIWVPTKLSEQLAIGANDPRVGIIYGRSIIFGRGLRERDYDHRHEFRPLPQGDVWKALLVDACYICMSSAMLRRCAIIEAGKIPETVTCIPDYFLFLSIARRYQARALENPVCRYRIHGQNMSAHNALKIQQETLWLLDHFEPVIEPAVIERRRRVHNTVLAVQELLSQKTAPRGFVRLVMRGSIPYLLSRPFVRLFRTVRRIARRPYYLSQNTVREGPAYRVGREGRFSQAGTSRICQTTILGTRVTACTFAAAQELLAHLVGMKGGAYVSPATAYGLTLARRVPRYKQALDAADHVTADGMPIVWLLNWMGLDSERVHNDDLFFACCERFSKWRHFLVGGRIGQPEQVIVALQQRFPGINIVGWRATPERPVPQQESKQILEAINACKPDIIWVGMGTPAQDYWMNAVSPRVSVPMVGVGSVFDLLSGRTKAAPDWMKRNGLQWVFRLWQEPRRLALRYTYYNLLFILACLRQMIGDLTDTVISRLLDLPAKRRT